jgi:hypothetical protein
MRRQEILGFSAAAAFAFLMGHDVTVAQAQTTPPVPDASGGLSRPVTLSPAEELTQGDAFLARMDGSRTVVRRQLETARAQRDVVKTLCLNDKLNQLDVAIRSAHERRQSLEAAAQRSDADLSNHEFTILTVLRQRSEQLTAEANQCIGQEAAFIGESAVTTQIDPSIPVEQEPIGPPTLQIVLEPPLCSSCFK